MGLWRSPVALHHAFTCYPPMSDTSQDRELVDMFES